MARTLGKASSGAQTDYRQRYLDLLDERDRALLAGDERIAEVAGLLGRLTRAVTAAGDAKLARRIQALCETLRSRPMDPAAGRRLRIVRDDLLGYMDRQERETWALVQSLSRAADQLETLVSSWRLRGSLKRFRKQLKAGTAGTGALVEELVELQQRVLAHLAQTPEPDDGLANDAPGVGQAATVEQSDAQGGPESDPAVPLANDPRPAPGPHAPGAPSGSLAGSAESVDWEAVRAVLSSMLQALELPASARREAESVQELLAEPMSEAVLLQALERLGALTDAALLGLRGEFSGFLDGVDRQLDQLLGALAGASDNERADRVRRRELAGQMRDQLSSLRVRASETGDLDDLKSSIEDHLQRLVDTLGSLSAQDEPEVSNSQAQLEAMRERLAALESESADARRQLQTQRRLALTDPLTGIANRLGFDEQAQQAVSTAAQGGAPLSLAMVDIDHFKSVNDTYGHPAGDRALCLVANILRSRIRATDICARFGGEEFVVLFTGADAAVAARVMDQVRVFLSEVGVNHQGQHIALTASFGVTQVADGEPLESAIARADQALYAAKNGGRNRVVTG